MAQQFQAVKCYKCNTFQVQQVKKVQKFNCAICGEKQTIQHVYAISDAAKDIRFHVQKLNVGSAQAHDAEEGAAFQRLNQDSADEQVDGLQAKTGPTPKAACDWTAFADDDGGYYQADAAEDDCQGLVTVLPDGKRAREMRGGRGSCPNKQRRTAEESSGHPRRSQHLRPEATTLNGRQGFSDYPPAGPRTSYGGDTASPAQNSRLRAFQSNQHHHPLNMGRNPSLGWTSTKQAPKLQQQPSPLPPPQHPHTRMRHPHPHRVQHQDHQPLRNQLQSPQDGLGQQCQLAPAEPYLHGTSATERAATGTSAAMWRVGVTGVQAPPSTVPPPGSGAPLSCPSLKGAPGPVGVHLRATGVAAQGSSSLAEAHWGAFSLPQTSLRDAEQHSLSQPGLQSLPQPDDVLTWRAGPERFGAAAGLQFNTEAAAGTARAVPQPGATACWGLQAQGRKVAAGGGRWGDFVDDGAQDGWGAADGDEQDEEGFVTCL